VNTDRRLLSAVLFTAFLPALCVSAAGQDLPPSPMPAASKVTQIDTLGLKRLLKPNGKPLLINFWATWCDPCREEYPDLVKIDQEYKGKIDFLTVSLDDATDKDTAVPKFLAEMRAEMPTYLLVTRDENGAMAAVSRDWAGGLPFTILYDAKGGALYSRQGKVRIDILRSALDKAVTPAVSAPAPSKQ
jgi:thiol-disulfide isomerase/thioredoxin